MVSLFVDRFTRNAQAFLHCIITCDFLTLQQNRLAHQIENIKVYILTYGFSHFLLQQRYEKGIATYFAYFACFALLKKYLGFKELTSVHARMHSACSVIQMLWLFGFFVLGGRLKGWTLVFWNLCILTTATPGDTVVYPLI